MVNTITYPTSSGIRPESTSSAAAVKRDCCVYAFHMAPTAWSIPALRKMNPRFSFNERKTTLPIYVGQTSKSVDQRYKDHCNANAFTSTRWGRHHFLPEFGRAFDRSIRKRRAEYAKQREVDMNALTRQEAQYHERHFAQWLRQEGYAVYFA